MWTRSEEWIETTWDGKDIKQYFLTKWFDINTGKLISLYRGEDCFLTVDFREGQSYSIDIKPEEIDFVRGMLTGEFDNTISVLNISQNKWRLK